MFKQVTAKIDFPEMERRILDWWEKEGIVKKYLERNNPPSPSESEGYGRARRFSFLDGPITANNPMGVHHAWGRTYKDLWQRYKNMQGFRQRFQNGFDCQGLWVEVEVEKALGFNSKKDIDKFGIGQFTSACKERVNEFARKQTEQSQRLGYFMDWDHSYYTMSETNNLYIWRFLKICHERGLIYKDKSSTTWCPRCETGLSRHEQADSYQDIKDVAVYIKFRVKDKPNEYFLVWTTTPWTISANVLLAINTSYEYVKAKADGEFYYLAKESAKRLGLDDYEVVSARELLNREYESVYDIPAQQGIRHFVVEWDLVNPAEGTGIVHVAPGCGEEDFELGRKLKVPALSPLNEAGVFIEGYGDLSGEFAHDVGDRVIDYLKKIDSLFKTESCVHSYPHCWRCKAKCLFRLEENWFINCQKIKEGLKRTASKAKWIPEFVGKRMQNWLDNMGDWMISRKRFYGLALPFYECPKCGQLAVIGGEEELRRLAVNPKLVEELPSFHRPWIDEIKIKCPKCGEAVSRIKEVGDCWLDAGVVPFSTLKYFEDKDYWERWFPADFICEMVEQVRLWYYSMLVYGYIFESKIPYRIVLNYVEVRDEKGERMSKTKGNGIPFDEAVEKMGADVMRWIYLRQNPEINLQLGYRSADETRRRFHLMLWNVYNFFVTYASVDKAQISNRKTQSDNILDKWILSRLNQTIKVVTEKLDQYDAMTASGTIEEFVGDLSTWYVRRSRDRVGPTAGTWNKDKAAFYNTMYSVLITLCKLLAPFTPFLAEEIYQNFTNLNESKTNKNESASVHLESWPEANEELVNTKVESEMEMVRKICELGHAERKSREIKVRQPLGMLHVTCSLLNDFDKQLVQLIKEELNVKEVEFLTRKGELRVELETKITPELAAEGETREIVRQIQEARKEAGCRLDQWIVVELSGWPQEFTDYIKKETLARELVKAKELRVLPQ
ncbi:isoleucine--tRNA ligase [Candidatus Shapirobacteria bacterium]|nr:isoleucine--tRNA ligase [Candidatus Shapirobacteria bacterium]